MAKICFPHPVKGDFETLNQGFESLKKMPDGWAANVLTDIVQYNVCYRDYLREHGVDSMVERLLSEVPALKYEDESLKELHKWWNCLQKVSSRNRDFHFGDIDIQCYNINEKVTVLGYEFNGLEDIIAHRSIRANESYTGQDDEVEYIVEYFDSDFRKPYFDPYIVELWRQCPTLERVDRRSDILYRNYLFVAEPITVEELAKSFIPTSLDFCMARDYPCAKWNLPLLYYKGEGDYMLLAASKQK